ncbi:high-affinity iron transporter [Pseudomonas sp. SJZ079]|uniref:cytochrome c/FTR1 family iron permease n=1 Tax=Pseudomonas sp. SJZ079 TaxID=2572887 RepID=UPI00119BE2BE|nr:cytochrome c/FTR1 family iron permease [Pseudomonas sp. SJZ079]TWC32430.1 high-affinity iron transporter [Pseudomonas sp. SJZ079]
MLRCPRWLAVVVVSALSLISLVAFAETGDSAARSLHLLGYIGADYPLSVSAGRVVDSAEYRQQLEFLAVLQGLIVALPARAGRVELEQGVVSLREVVSQRRDGPQVTRQARQLATRLAEVYGVTRAPAITPDAARGAPLFAQQCAVCHGDSGAGDGPAGIGLLPPPADLRDSARLDRMSLYDLFNTLGLGIDGTDMPAFADQLDERQRWDLASYIASFTADPAQAGNSRFSLAELAGSTPEEIAGRRGAQDAAAFRAQRARPPQAQRGPQELLEFSATTLEQSLQAYRDGRSEQAYDLAVAAYLEGFELVESALDNLDPLQRKSAERALMAYRQALQDAVSPARAAQALAMAKAALDESAKLLAGGQMNASLSFLSSLLILLREGLEAILVLAAILAYLNNTGQQQAARSVHLGWALALLAGLGSWALAAYVIDVSGAQRELLEGVTALFASVVLLWVGVWMHDRRHAAAWQTYINASLVGGGGRFGFAVLAFFSVYRELFEVILFYETLWLQAGPAGHGMVLAGAATAVLLLVGLAWVVLRGSRKLPLATFFSANAILLCVLSVVFAGHGVAALQEAGVLGTRPVSFVDFDWLGIHADAYSLSAQAVATLAVIALYARSWRGERRRASVEHA